MIFCIKRIRNPKHVVNKPILCTTARSADETGDAQQQTDSWIGVSLWQRIRVASYLLRHIRWHDFRAARTFLNTMYPGQPLWLRLPRFVTWALRQMFLAIPEAWPCVRFRYPVSRRPFWLTADNPHENHPWQKYPEAQLPRLVDTIVIGAGFTGGAVAYHWGRRAPLSRSLVVLEKNDPASGASGRNEGAVVCGRYFTFVRDRMIKALPKLRPELDADQRRQLAEAFADTYVRAAYRSSEMIKHTIETECFDCDYQRLGWVQARDPDQQADLAESVRSSQSRGFTDWQMIDPQEVYRKTGMKVEQRAGYSQNCASWHPAKWVWCLFTAALRHSNVQLFTRTEVLNVEDAGDHYRIHTNRGVVRARHVVNATESYTPRLHPQFRNRLDVHQTQAASGRGGPAAMKPHVIISGTKAFWGKHADTLLFGSDSTVIPYQNAGQNKPSRFITMFFAAHMKEFYGPYRFELANEWSGTVGHTLDEYPIVGLMDDKRQYIVAGMCGSGSNVSFNAGRCIVNRILELHDEPDDYPPEFFGPTRVIHPETHPWPEISEEVPNDQSK